MKKVGNDQELRSVLCSGEVLREERCWGNDEVLIRRLHMLKNERNTLVGEEFENIRFG